MCIRWKTFMSHLLDVLVVLSPLPWNVLHSSRHQLVVPSGLLAIQWVTSSTRYFITLIYGLLWWYTGDWELQQVSGASFVGCLWDKTPFLRSGSLIFMALQRGKVHSKLFQPCFHTKTCSAWLVKVYCSHQRAVSKGQHGLSRILAENTSLFRDADINKFVVLN